MRTLDILIPYYGDAGLLRTAVRSVLAQSDPDWALTVVDDGRAEGVPEWFAGLGDPRVRYLRNETNLGINRNFQKCVDLATAERMVIMGCDDVMLPGYVAAVRAADAVYPGAGMIQPGVEVIDGNGVVTRSVVDTVKARVYRPRFTGRTVVGGEDLAASLLRGNWLYFPSICWRTDAVKAVGFRPGLDIVLDLALVLDLLERGEQMVLDETVVFQYRRHAVSLSSAQAFDGKRFVEEREFFRATADRFESRGWRRAARAGRAHLSSRVHALTMLPGAVRARDRRGARVLGEHVLGRRSGPPA